MYRNTLIHHNNVNSIIDSIVPKYAVTSYKYSLDYSYSDDNRYYLQTIPK